MIVHPTFDLVNGVWFTDNGLVAKSLRELKSLLPKGTRIEGYYPNGYVAVRENDKKESRPTRYFTAKSKAQTVFTRRLIQQQQQNGALPEPKPSLLMPGRKKYDTEVILDQWFRGDPTEAIMRAAGIPTRNSFKKLIAVHRKRGDPRAIKRQTSRKRTPEECARMEQLRLKGWTYRQIANEFGVTIGAIAGNFNRG